MLVNIFHFLKNEPWVNAYFIVILSEDSLEVNVQHRFTREILLFFKINLENKVCLKDRFVEFYHLFNEHIDY